MSLAQWQNTDWMSTDGYLPIMSVCVSWSALVMEMEHLSDMFFPRPSSMCRWSSYNQRTARHSKNTAAPSPSHRWTSSMSITLTHRSVSIAQMKPASAITPCSTLLHKCGSITSQVTDHHHLTISVKDFTYWFRMCWLLHNNTYFNPSVSFVSWMFLHPIHQTCSAAWWQRDCYWMDPRDVCPSETSLPL